jgi:hypothetical protein
MGGREMEGERERGEREAGRERERRGRAIHIFDSLLHLHNNYYV